MSITWYADRSAQVAHIAMRDELKQFVAQMFPQYELSHSGFNRNEITGEVIVNLHLNPIGRVKVAGDLLAIGNKEPQQ